MIQQSEKKVLGSKRPTDWGLKEKHPLYDSWCWIKKMKAKHTVDESWEDFWKFVQDVGERPTKTHRLCRKIENLGYGPSNYYWKAELGNLHDSRAEYARKWRKANPDKTKSADLKKVYGIDLEEYNLILKRQNYRCAICNLEKCPSKLNFAVDHCHFTKKIRGLLCVNCNKILGHAKDDIRILNTAIEYLNLSQLQSSEKIIAR